MNQTKSHIIHALHQDVELPVRRGKEGNEMRNIIYFKQAYKNVDTPSEHGTIDFNPC